MGIQTVLKKIEMKLERLSAKIFTHWQAIWMIFTNQTAVDETFLDE